MDATDLKPAYIIVLKWMAIWLLLGALHSFYLKPHAGLVGDNPLSGLFYIFCLLSCIYVVQIQSLFEHHDRLIKQLSAIFLFSVLIILLGYFYNYLRPVSFEQAQLIKSKTFEFPLFYLKAWSVKWSDVAYQQVMIFAVLYKLNSLRITKKQIVWVASTGFALLHFPLFMVFGFKAIYFVIPSIFAGFIFTYLILHYKRGVFYSFAVHLSFYLVLGILIRELI
jgi:hypothetical protein